MQYNGDELEHETALLYALQALQPSNEKIIFVGGGNGLLDRLDGLSDVDDYTALHAKDRSGSVTENFELAVRVVASDEGGDFSGSNVETDGYAVGIHRADDGEVRVNTTWSAKRTSMRSSWSRYWC